MKITALILGIIGGVICIIFSIPFLMGWVDLGSSFILGFPMLFCGILGLFGGVISAWKSTIGGIIMMTGGLIISLAFIIIFLVFPASLLIIAGGIALGVKSKKTATA